MESVSEPEAPAEDPLRGSVKAAINEENPDLEGAAPSASEPEKSQVGDSDAQRVSQQENSQDGEGQIGEEEEDEGECGFCLFMKSGSCRENFIKWEECVEEAENAKEDIVSKCHQVTLLLKECMENNADYYDPVLRAEKEMGEQAALEEANTLQEANVGTGSEVPREQNHAESRSSPEPQQQEVQGGLKPLDEESSSEQPTELQNSAGAQPAHQE